jgi:hypothetical protein
VTLTRTNALIAAAITLVNSIFPFLQLIGVLHLTSDGMAALYLVVSNAGTVIGLVFASTPATNTPAP